VHELLIRINQRHIEIFPATPEDWNTVSFQSRRTEGAFLDAVKNKENDGD